MLKDRILELLSTQYENRILIFDFESICKSIDYVEWIKALDFEVIYYSDKLEFRILYENDIKHSQGKIATIIEQDIYVPYDIRRFFYQVDLHWSSIYPKLDSQCFLGTKYISHELIYLAHKDYVGSKLSHDQTRMFIDGVYTNKGYVSLYTKILYDEITNILKNVCLTHKDWFKIAKKYAEIIYYDDAYNNNYDFSEINQCFSSYIIAEYGKIPSVIDSEGPVINTKVIDYMLSDQRKIAFIVMDGMSIPDYYVIRKSLSDFELEEKFVFSMIPTTTPVSRQSLVTGKFPVEISNPFSLKDEKKIFVQSVLSYGYKENQIEYSNDMNHEIGSNTQCLLLILNNIDDMIHSQTQGRSGLVSDIEIFNQSKALHGLISKLLQQGFAVYMSSDHGSTQARGLGKLMKTGVEVETRSSRMLILKDIVQESEIVEKYKLMKYPGYFLDKNYNYYLCNYGESMDVKGSITLCHGGASIEEVIVPFVRVKEKRNG